MPSPSNDFELVSTPRPDWRWARVDEVARIIGCTRSTVFTLIKDGVLRTALLRRRGKKLGIRLINLDSLDLWLAANATGGEKKN